MPQNETNFVSTLDLADLAAEAARLDASTPEQRRCLYRNGRSRNFVHRFAATKADAHTAIAAALAEREAIEAKITPAPLL